MLTIDNNKLLTSVPLDMNGKALNTVALPATREDGLPRKYVDKNIHNINDRSMSNENKLYLSLFRQWYEGYEYLIPYYWMPKWSEIDYDPSGRLILGE